MAQPQGNMPSVDQFIRTAIYDAYGSLVLLIGMSEFLVIEADGTASEYKCGDNIVLEDGVVWNPSMLMHANPVLLATCSLCRRQRGSLFGHRRAAHGLLSAHNARVCAGCGAVTCPRHRRLVGRRWYCLGCSRTKHFKHALRSIFFRREEDMGEEE